MSMQTEPAASVRLDLWLWAARFYKTRALARHAIETGKVDVGGQRAKPSRGVRIGDALVVARLEERFEIEVLALSDVRGPASVAQALYRESEVSKRAREQARALRSAERAGFRPPETKPDKRQLLFDNTARAMGDAPDFIKRRHVENCSKADPAYGAGVEAALRKLGAFAGE